MSRMLMFWNGQKNTMFRPLFLTGQNFVTQEKMLHQLQADGIDFIILAGFLWLMPACITAAFPNRIINIHPALLPAYGGKGMYGHHVHEAVIAAGEKESGITIHYVNDHYDQGAIIFQAKCPVLPTDTPDDLAARVHELEYRYFPQIIEETILKQEVWVNLAIPRKSPENELKK